DFHVTGVQTCALPISLPRHGCGTPRPPARALGRRAADRPAQLQPSPRRTRCRAGARPRQPRHRTGPDHCRPRALGPDLRALRRHPPRDAGLRTRAGRARQRALPHRRGFPGMGACALGRPGLHDLAGVQEDLHGRTQRPGRCRGAVRAARGPAARGGRDTSRLRGTTMNVAVHGPTLRPLPPVAAGVDAALADIDAGLDWLLALTPLGTDALWDEFEASGHARVSPLRYAEPALDLDAMRRRLLELPVERIESPLLAGVLAEKQRELDRMIELVRLRGTEGFVSASIDLFAGVEPGLLELAHATPDGV